jgi:Fe-Mn family superoxide dismutase
MTIELPDLPYAHEALEPLISATTLKTHHGKHHRGYVDKLNALTRNTDLTDSSLETIVKQSARRSAADPAAGAIFNNAAQAWNHAFYWKSLRPRGGSAPQGKLAALIARSFGSHAAFSEAFKSAATSHFGSGWAWLVLGCGALSIVTTANADTPIIRGQTPLLVIDVWEHAYYLDRQERRAAYVADVVDHLLDWDFAARNLRGREAARGDGVVSARPDMTATTE